MRRLLMLLTLLIVPLITYANENPLEEMRSKLKAAEERTAAIANEIRDGNESETATTKLREAVEKAFEIRCELQEAELQHAVDSIEQTKTRLKRRRELAESIINARVAELMSSDELEWETKAKATTSATTGRLDSVRPPIDLSRPESEPLDPNTMLVSSAFGMSAKQPFDHEIRLINSRAKTSLVGGLKITKVLSGTLANKMGLRPQDILFGLDQYSITSFEQFESVCNRLLKSEQKQVRFYLVRDAAIVFVGTLDVDDLREASEKASVALISSLMGTRESLLSQIDRREENLEKSKAVSTDQHLVEWVRNNPPQAITDLRIERVQVEAVLNQLNGLGKKIEENGDYKEHEILARIESLTGWLNVRDRDQPFEEAKAMKQQELDTIDAKMEAIQDLVIENHRASVEISFKERIESEQEKLNKARSELKEVEASLEKITRQKPDSTP